MELLVFLGFCLVFEKFIQIMLKLGPVFIFVFVVFFLLYFGAAIATYRDNNK